RGSGRRSSRARGPRRARPTAAAPADAGKHEPRDGHRATARRGRGLAAPRAIAGQHRRIEPRTGDLVRLPRHRDVAGSGGTMLRARVDRHKCIGAGNCITLAPSAFDWLAGEYGKAEVVGPETVEDELLLAAAFACPTGAVVVEEVEDLLPWQL